MGRRVINENIEIDNSKCTLKEIASKAYGTVRFPDLTINSTTTSKEATITLHTIGRPVFALCTGCIIPTSTAWIRITLYRNGILLKNQIVQGYGTSAYKAFSLNFLDYPARGTHVYKIVFSRGSGDCQLGNGLGNNSPVFSAFEI